MKLQDIQLPPIFGRKRVRCEVRPRYTPGSPASVPDHIAIRVAHQERESYEQTLTGIYGEEQKRRAEVLGLRGIAFAMAEQGSGRNFRWLIYDLVTRECFRRLDDAGIERVFGAQRYSELPERVKRLVNKTGFEGDYERTFWFAGTETDRWHQYEPELVRDGGAP